MDLDQSAENGYSDARAIASAGAGILDRYKDDPQCLIKKRLLPVLSNQKMNTYLKEIADACKITKKMTFHTARHTFATTVTLSNGVPIGIHPANYVKDSCVAVDLLCR